MQKDKYISQVNGHALVFGGSGGIGSEIVRALVANGARAVTLTYGRNKDAAEALKAELVTEGVKVHFGAPDLSDSLAVREFLNESVSAVGEEISVAVNSVGISPDTPYEEQTPELWRRVYEVNVVGCHFSSLEVALRMREKNMKGSLVWITSTNGINSHAPFSAPYDVSKAGQIHDMLIMAQYFASSGIRINGIAPGWIKTLMNTTVPEAEMLKEIERIWIKRMADPAEIARVAAFLASDASSYIIGQNLIVDGGYPSRD
jgi:3-oxoacyl-[acyl-carrier protein] reductase